MSEVSVRSKGMEVENSMAGAQVVSCTPVSGVEIPERPVASLGISEAVALLGEAVRAVVPKEEHDFLVVRQGWTFNVDRSGSEGIEIFLGDRLVKSSVKRIGEVLAAGTMQVHAAGINESLHSNLTQRPIYSRHELVYECVRELESLFSEEGADPAWRADYLAACFEIQEPDSVKGLMRRLRVLRRVLAGRLRVRKVGRPKKVQDCEGPDETCQMPQ